MGMPAQALATQRPLLNGPRNDLPASFGSQATCRCEAAVNLEAVASHGGSGMLPGRSAAVYAPTSATRWAQGWPGSAQWLSHRASPRSRGSSLSYLQQKWYHIRYC